MTRSLLAATLYSLAAIVIEAIAVLRFKHAPLGCALLFVGSVGYLCAAMVCAWGAGKDVGRKEGK